MYVRTYVCIHVHTKPVNNNTVIFIMQNKLLDILKFYTIRSQISQIT